MCSIYMMLPNEEEAMNVDHNYHFFLSRVFLNSTIAFSISASVMVIRTQALDQTMLGTVTSRHHVHQYNPGGCVAQTKVMDAVYKIQSSDRVRTYLV